MRRDEKGVLEFFHDILRDRDGEIEDKGRKNIRNDWDEQREKSRKERGRTARKKETNNRTWVLYLRKRETEKKDRGKTM